MVPYRHMASNCDCRTNVPRITGLPASLERPSLATTAAVAPTPAIARWLRDNLAHPWRLASDQARAKVVAAIYDRIVMENGRIVGVELTTEAKQHGLMLGILEAVVLARPAGVAGTSPTSVWSRAYGFAHDAGGVGGDGGHGWSARTVNVATAASISSSDRTVKRSANQTRSTRSRTRLFS